ncbi:FUSC family protein [Nonomuraea sp. NPDC049152]|uniref:FUSC family protein n=1 Tax=Nonomuraea sp. NPDC049152 TaxID=3154350 RepID=UPI0033BFE8D6
MRIDVRGRMDRLALMAPSIAQCALAAAVAWLAAKDLLGHARPFFAPIAVVLCIGVGLGARLRRVAELVVGVGLGVGVGDLLISQIGSGPWQVALVVALAMGVAVLLDSGSLIVLQAGSSAVLVATLLPPSGTGGLDRMVDALLGGVLGIAAVALMPADTAAIAHRHATAALDALAEALEDTAEALEKSDPELAAAALEEARGTQKAVEQFAEALQTSKEIIAISPLRRRRRRELLLRYETALTPVDHALRNTRVLARRALVAVDQGAPVPPWLPGALHDLSAAVLLLRDELPSRREPEGARSAILAVAAALPGDREGFAAGVLVAQLRSIVVDLLQATGASREEAAAALPPLSD